MYQDNNLWIAQTNDDSKLNLSIVGKMANRHGLIAGATGTGKTITLKVMAETFSDAGIPVFIADMKGDVSGLGAPGVDNPKMQEFIAKYGFTNFTYKGFPVSFWDIFGEKGVPLRTTISEMGPTLLANLLELNDTQSDILSIIFKIADDSGLLLLDMKDLRSLIQFVSENHKELSVQYGNMTTQSLGSISRSLIALENEGAGFFFGEPAFDISDWITTTADGKGIINILDSTKLIQYPKLYSTFLLWMLSELYETMPEVGDMDKPKMIFFFDEAHLLFKDAPKALLDKIEQIIKLIRSKGIGIYFCSQSPSDIPDDVLSQLGNRIQHALRAYTPADQKTVKAAAAAFRVNPALNTEEVITTLGTGQALVSFLDEKGAPQIVQQANILCPESLMAAIDDNERASRTQSSIFFKKYGTAVDSESAYELLEKRFEEEQEAEKEAEKLKEEELQAKEDAKLKKEEERQRAAQLKTEAAEERLKAAKSRNNPLSKMFSSAATTIGREATKTLLRGIMGSFKK